jgi:hypothetical protein
LAMCRREAGAVSVRLRSGTGDAGRRATCTLLGPEGSATAARRGPPSDFGSIDLIDRPECRPYVENYTVDASIFDSPSSDGGSNRCVRSDSSERIHHWSCPSRFAVTDTIHTHVCGQVSKSKRWMPWHLEPKKDVAICDKPRGVDKRTSIRGSPNGETPPGVAIRPGDSRLNI